MWRKLAPVVVVLAALIAAIVWKMHGGDHDHAAVTEQRGSAAAVRTGPHPPAAPAAIGGHVTKRGGGAIAGATVTVAHAEFDMKSMGGGGGGDELVVVTTDAAGAWSAPQVAPGVYAIAATAGGFLPARHDRVTIEAGERRDNLDLVLAPGGTLVHGTVSDVGGGGIPGARVSAMANDFDVGKLMRREAPFSTLTGADGTYELALPDGSYRLAASHDDYTNRSRTIAVAGKPLVADFSLVPGAVVRGQVVARDSGKPVPGAVVDATSGGRRMGRQSGSATADAEGKFVVRHLSSGHISLTAFGYGYASQSPTEVSVGIGEQVDGVRVLVDRALSISGRVVEKGTQKGVPGVVVVAGSFSGGGNEARALEPSDKDGAFQIVGVKPGTYMVFAISEDKMPELAKSIDVSDKDVTGLVIEMATGATLSGRVDPPGPASIGVSMVGDIGLGNIMEAMKTFMVHGDADATGNFVVRHVPAGKFTLVATTTTGPAGSIPITVAETDMTGLVIPLETRASISGRVVDTSGKAVAGMQVSAHETGGDTQKSIQKAMMMVRSGATSSDDGSFKIVGLEPGKYLVTARDEGDYAAFFNKKDKKAEEPIELAAGAERTGVVVTVEAKDGVIHGVVIGSDGKPAGDAWVVARQELDNDKSKAMAKLSEYGIGMTSQPVLTNSDGKFVIEKLKKGTYTLIADGPRGGSRGEKAGVATGDTATITLQPLGTLSGHVMSRAAPVATYDLVCRGPVGRIDRHVDAADGAYVLEHLAPGHYDCDASADAGTATGSSDVPAGAATLEMQLVPWASVIGTVVNVLTGGPIAGVYPILSGDSGKGMAAAIFGNGPVTDAAGKFTIDRVAAGSGSVTLYSKIDIAKPLAAKPYTVTQGQQLDLGTIKVIAPRNSDAGTLGMATEIQGDALAVTLVSTGGPAAAAGIVVGDKIISLDGKSVADLTPDIAQKILSSGIIGEGMQLVLGLERGATVTVTAAKW